MLIMKSLFFLLQLVAEDFKCRENTRKNHFHDVVKRMSHIIFNLITLLRKL